MKIIEFFRKKYVFAVCYTLLVAVCSVFLMLEALVFESNVKDVQANKFQEEEYKKANKLIDDYSYKDENIEINITEKRLENSDIYIADVKINDIKYFKSAFANDKYGKNVLECVSNMAKKNKAIFAVNGDYYGFRDAGFVIRNNIVYRNTARSKGKDSSLLVYKDGSFGILNERVSNLDMEVEKAKQNNNPITQAYSFGPTLIYNNEIVYSNEVEDVAIHPRTAVGIIEPLHYVFVCVDGRSDASAGFTIAQLANFMKELKCKIAYNLDGGGSSTMYFNGRIINKPSDGFEREVSDIVYIGY